MAQSTPVCSSQRDGGAACLCAHTMQHALQASVVHVTFLSLSLSGCQCTIFWRWYHLPCYCPHGRCDWFCVILFFTVTAVAVLVPCVLLFGLIARSSSHIGVTMPYSTGCSQSTWPPAPSPLHFHQGVPRDGSRSLTHLCSLSPRPCCCQVRV